MVATILNIIIGVFCCIYGVNMVMWWIDNGANSDFQYSVQWLFFGICVIILGLVLVFVEIKFKHDKVLAEFGLLKHYLGRGSYAFFIGALSFGRGSALWNENMKYGGVIGLTAGILQWFMYFCMDCKNCPH